MITLRITWKYLLAFYCVIMLYVSLHELVHHFAGFAVCGGVWGFKSFNYFETACEGSGWTYLATYMGPIFSFAAMWAGAYLLKQGKTPYRSHLGFALIFAQLPAQRMITPFFKMNDEFYASSALFGDTPLVYWSVLLIIWAVCIPPLVVAYRSIENRRAWLWFANFFLLLPYIIWGPVFGGLEYLMVGRGFLDQTIYGIGLLFIINEVVTIAAYWRFKHFIDPFRE
ncbi:MAG: hypothetical protein O3B41_08875 [Bacteroidetes bacterium]|nr:hypothetical protein [Bacteroidota bacterium]